MKRSVALKARKDTISSDMLALIPVGAENAISGKDLSKKFGVSTRQLRTYIHDARLADYPILSDVNGYYWASGENERRAFLAAWGKRIKSSFETTAPARRTA